MPWRLIDGPEAADAVAAEIARAPYRRASRTSISGGLLFASKLFETSGYRGTRRVIDVSGDGANNAGEADRAGARRRAAQGITINGLPIMLKRPNPGTMDIENLDIYYEDCVIGGPGAFVVPIQERTQFIDATRTKLMLEIAGRQPEPRVDSGVGRKAAHLLHHRRAAVARPLGRGIRFSLKKAWSGEGGDPALAGPQLFNEVLDRPPARVMTAELAASFYRPNFPTTSTCCE